MQSDLSSSESDTESQDEASASKRPSRNPGSSERGVSLVLNPEYIELILEDHKKYPPLHNLGAIESKFPAPQKTLDYFNQVFMLKREKYHEILTCSNIPKALKSVPLALNYQSFILSYWPGPLLCCNNSFLSVRSFAKHIYEFHLPPLVPPILSTVNTKSKLLAKTPVKMCLGSSSSLELSDNLSESDETRSKKSRNKNSELNDSRDPLELNSSLTYDGNGNGAVLSPKKQSVTLNKTERLGNESRIVQSPKKSPSCYSTANSSSSITYQQPNTSNDTPVSSCLTIAIPSRRRPLSPSSRPSPLSVKLQRLSGKAARSAENSIPKSIDFPSNSLSSICPERSHEISPIPSSSQNTTDGTTDEKTPRTRPRRSCTTKRLNDNVEESSWPLDCNLDELIEDQQKYEPQHESGTTEDFPSDQARLDYFIEVLKLKLTKYSHLNESGSRSPSCHIPLALSLPGFIRHYWPGKVQCCRKERETSASLEAHISRHHKPPKALPEISLIKSRFNDNESDTDHETGRQKNSHTELKNRSVEKHSPGKYPVGFIEDQNNYLPQHKIGDPEDFLANKDSIDYFMEVYYLKRNRYAQFTRSKKKPLGGTFAMLSECYWPGVVSCCGIVLNSSESFKKHIAKKHTPPSKQDPVLSTVDSSYLPITSPPSKRRRDQREGTPSSMRLTPTPAVTATSLFSAKGTVKETRDHKNPLPDSIEEEVRQLRRQLVDMTSVTDLLGLLGKILEQALTLSEHLGSLTERSDRRLVSESLETVWGASKHAIVRWQELADLQGSYLLAVQYAYRTVPVFINWDNSDHISVVDHVIRLTYATVRLLQNTQNEKPKYFRPAILDVMVKEEPVLQWPMLVPKIVPGSSTSLNSVEAINDIEKRDLASTTNSIRVNGNAQSSGGNLSVKEFCRRVNIALTENTKSRLGYKDSNGSYHPIYRYSSIVPMLKLYAPPKLTHLRCCGSVYTLSGVRTHVSKVHEGPDPKKAPSLAPL